MLQMRPGTRAGIHAIDMNTVAARLALCGRERSNVGVHDGARFHGCGPGNGEFEKLAPQLATAHRPAKKADAATEVGQSLGHGVARSARLRFAKGAASKARLLA